MKKFARRAAAMGLSVAMLLSLSTVGAYAAEDMPQMPEGEMPDMPAGEGGGGGGGGGGTAAPSVSYQTLDVLGANAALFVKDGEVTTKSELITQGDAAGVTGTSISGLYISAETIGQWNKDNDSATGVAGTSGIIIKNTSTGAAAGDAVVIGGEEDVYEVDGEGYNLVIQLDNQDGDQPNTLYTAEDWLIDNGDNSNCTYPGVGIAVSAAALKIQNAYVETKGYHRPALATYDSATDSTTDLSPEVVVEDSVLASWGSEGAGSSAPTFTCMYGSARPVIINASADSYFFNSDILSSDWGSYSLDQCSNVTVSIVNSYNVNTVGGYGVYAIGATNTVDLYGTTSVSAQYGAIVCAGGSATIYDLSDALENEELMSHYDGTLTEADALNEGGSNVMVGSANAVTFTADVSGASVISSLKAEDTYFSTLDEDCVYEGEQLTNVMDSYDWLTNYAAISGGAPYFFLNYIDGATLCYRSVNSVLELTSCQLESKTGTVIQTVLGYDTSANGIDIADGTVYPGYDFTLRDMEVSGDILHEDYQRQLTLTLDDVQLEGAVVTGTMASWNATMESYVDELWNSTDPAVGGSVSEAALAAGCTEENIIAALEKNDSYESFYGAALNLENGSVWTVTDTSSLSSLTLAEGTSVQAPEGKTLQIYTDVAMANADESFDVSTGKQVDSLSAGTYENVVILVTDASEEPAVVFTDLAPNSGDMADYAYAAQAAGLMQGDDTGAFRPQDTLTRAEAAVVVLNLLGVTPTEGASASFSDVAADAWYAEVVAAAVEQGFVNGYPDGTFGPEKNITRAEFATMLVKALDLSTADAGTVSFPDVTADHWAAANIAAVKAAGIISGRDDGTFDPDAAILRWEAAAMAVRSK